MQILLQFVSFTDGPIFLFEIETQKGFIGPQVVFHWPQSDAHCIINGKLQFFDLIDLLIVVLANNAIKTDVFLQTLLFLGAKSFSHSFSAISK